MIKITLFNCRPSIESLGIFMEERGEPDKLTDKIKEKISVEQGYLWHEYNFPPVDTLLIFVEDWTVIPDLSMFGEVAEIDGSMG